MNVRKFPLAAVRYGAGCLLVGLGLLATSCTRGRSRIETRSLSHPNPTTYTFVFPLERTRDQALDTFSIEHQVRAPMFPRSQDGVNFQTTLFPESSTNAVFGEVIFRDPANSND